MQGRPRVEAPAVMQEINTRLTRLRLNRRTFRHRGSSVIYVSQKDLRQVAR